MNRFAKTSIVISLGMCTFGAVLAADTGAPRTRAEVIAERDAASAAGLITAMAGEDSGSFHFSQQRWVSTRSRAEVSAEAVSARRTGELDAMTGEDSGSAYLARAQPATVLARAEVRDELRLARASGQLGALNGEDSGSVYLARAAAQRPSGRYVGPDPGREDAPAVQLTQASGAR